MADTPAGGTAPRVGLLVICLIDAMRPGIGFAAMQLLEEAGCTVEVPRAQTCCVLRAIGCTQAGPEGPTMRDRTVAYFPQYRGASFQAAAKRSEVRSRHGDWKQLPSGTMRARRRLSRNSQAMAAPPLASVFPAL